jgi:predicted ArsR family transcriptional regulator
MRLLGSLRADGPATATMLARQLNTNTGATSYHLRQLADVGLVAEETDRAAGRERWWRAVHDITSWRPTDFDDDPDATAASEWLEAHTLRYLTEQAERWRAERHTFDTAWQEAVSFGDRMLRLTPARLRALNDDLHELIERYEREPDSGDDTEQVYVSYAAFPRRAGW